MNDQPDKRSFDSWFLVAAAAMMVVIIALLAGLWLSMRARAIRAESELARLRPLVGKRDISPEEVDRVEEILRDYWPQPLDADIKRRIDDHVKSVAKRESRS